MILEEGLRAQVFDSVYEQTLASRSKQNKRITLTGCVNYYTGKITFEVSNKEVVEVYDAIGPAIADFNSQCGW